MTSKREIQEELERYKGYYDTARKSHQSSIERFSEREGELLRVLRADAKALGTYEVDTWDDSGIDVELYIDDRLAEIERVTETLQQLDQYDRLHPEFRVVDEEEEDSTDE